MILRAYSKMKDISFIKVIFVILLLAGMIYQFRYFHLTVEDAWISLKYARNLANGLGLVTNELGDHEEGFSNLTFVLAIAALGRLGIDYLIASKIIGIFSVIGSVLILMWALHLRHAPIKSNKMLTAQVIIACVVFLYMDSTVTWSTSGLETMLYAFLLTSQFAMLVVYMQTGSARLLILLPMICALAEMTRPEGLLLVIYSGCIIFLLSRYSRGMDLKSSMVRASTVIILSGFLVAVHIGWRLYYFGELLSNPAYVKLALSIWDPLSERASYIINYFIDQSWAHAILFAIGFLAVCVGPFQNINNPSSRQALSISAIALGFVIVEAIFVLYAGADYMAHFRFMAPASLMVAFVIAYGATVLFLRIDPKGKYLLSFSIIVAFCLCAVSVLKYTNRYSWYDTNFMMPLANSSRYGNKRDWSNISGIKSALEKIGSNTYAHSEYGFIPYHLPHLSGIDIMGLNNHVVAKTFSEYPVEEAARAARDYVLANLPGVISTYGYWHDKKGVHTLPSVGWFFAPYLDSAFFLKNYNVRYARSSTDTSLIMPLLKSEWVTIK